MNFIYRIQMKSGERFVTVQPDWYMDLLQHVMNEDGMASEDHFIIRGGEIAHVGRERVPS